ncbi:hypothetical protein GLW07_20490 [Bacillus hwajinpoensis]|uniref:Uncharacterized protein n=1 Tax=Guptibacillus hwajinpoensis TaxID=208199 RepID=A0A845F4V0_9BACL|nr:hypothetical protein [Pseudalkalibacillus hwajinpoensis]
MTTKKKPLTNDAIMSVLDWSYDKAINGGIPGIDTAIELGDNYLQKDGVDVKLNFTLFARFLFTLLLKICFSDFSYDDFPHFLPHV